MEDDPNYFTVGELVQPAGIEIGSNIYDVIFQKFLEKGHTQMECDSVHSAIETRIKNKDIYLPEHYSEFCLTARVKMPPYESVYLSHSFFSNFEGKSGQRYSFIRPGKIKGDPTVTDVRGLKYNPTGYIEFRLNYSDLWKKLPALPKNIVTQVFPPLHTEKLKITERKFKDL